jgi:hypothetical protein
LKDSIAGREMRQFKQEEAIYRTVDYILITALAIDDTVIGLRNKKKRLTQRKFPVLSNACHATQIHRIESHE